MANHKSEKSVDQRCSVASMGSAKAKLRELFQVASSPVPLSADAAETRRHFSRYLPSVTGSPL